MLALRQAAPRALAGSRRTLALAPVASTTPSTTPWPTTARPAVQRRSGARRSSSTVLHRRWFSDGDDSGVAEKIRGQLAAHFTVCPRLPHAKRLGAALRW